MLSVIELLRGSPLSCSTGSVRHALRRFHKGITPQVIEKLMWNVLQAMRERADRLTANKELKVLSYVPEHLRNDFSGWWLGSRVASVPSRLSHRRVVRRCTFVAWRSGAQEDAGRQLERLPRGGDHLLSEFQNRWS